MEEQIRDQFSLEQTKYTHDGSEENEIKWKGTKIYKGQARKLTDKKDKQQRKYACKNTERAK